MLRIEVEADGPRRWTIRAAGRLAGPWVGELQRSLASRDGHAVVVDLTEVSFVDRDGIEFLRTIRRDTRIVLRCSAFVTAQLT